MAENENFHGYAWSDGTTRDTPEPQREAAVVTTLFTPPPERKHVTQEQYDKAFAMWVREFNLWRKDMEDWRQKYGRK